MNKTRGILLIASMILLLLFSAGCSNKDVAASVNGESISMELFNQRVEEAKKNFMMQGLDFTSEEGKEFELSIKERVLDVMIEELLIIQQARAEGVLPSEEDIDKEIELIKTHYPTEEDYKNALKELNINEKDLRQAILAEYAMDNLYQKITEDVKEINSEQAREYYQQNKMIFSSPEKLEVRHILFFVNDGDMPQIPVIRSDDEAKRLAEQAINKINQGEDFAKLAKEQSEDTGSKEEGGVYIFAPAAGTTDKVFTEAAAALSVGEYTKHPVRSQFGYHVIKLDNIIPAKVEPFEEVEQFIIGQLLQEEKTNRFSQYMDDVKGNAKITRNVKV